MALRSAPSLRIRTVYEDFQPKSEMSETPEAHILQIHLPGFVKEQIRIRYLGITKMISISGERTTDGVYKRSRFNQAYPVPEICDVGRLKANLDQGILTITMPKKFISQVAAPQEVKTTQEKAPSPSEEAVAAPKTEKARVETPPKSTSTSVEKPRDKRSVSFADLKAPSPSKEAVAEPKTEKAQAVIPPKSTSTTVEEPREKKSVSFADQKAPKDQEDTTTAQKPLPDIRRPADDKELTSLTPPEHIKALSKPQDTTTAQKPLPDIKKSADDKELTSLTPPEHIKALTKPQDTTTAQKPLPDIRRPADDKELTSLTPPEHIKALTKPQDTTTAQKPLPDIKKSADDKELTSLTPPEPIKALTKPQVVQGEILQKPTVTIADPKLKTDSMAQKGQEEIEPKPTLAVAPKKQTEEKPLGEFEPKPTLPMDTKKRTDENTQKGPGEFVPKTTLTTAPLDLKKQIDDKPQKGLEEIMQKPGLTTVPKMQTDETIVGRRAEDAEKKEVKETIAKPFEPRMPEKGVEKGMVKATESKERKELGMAAKPGSETPEKEKEATSEFASIYKEKRMENIIDTIGRGIKEVAASTSYAVTNTAEGKLKDEEKNLLSMVIAALAAHVSYRLTSSGKLQN